MNRAIWQTFQDLRSSLSVSLAIRSVWTPRPALLIFCANAVPHVSRSALLWPLLRMLQRWSFVGRRVDSCFHSALAASDVHSQPWETLRDYLIY